MAETLTFAQVHQYDTKEPGITVYVKLTHAADEEEFRAKVDTGASHCIFGRAHGESLGRRSHEVCICRIPESVGHFLRHVAYITGDPAPHVRPNLTIPYLLDPAQRFTALDMVFSPA